MILVAGHLRSLACVAVGAALGLVAATVEPIPSTKANPTTWTVPPLPTPPCDLDSDPGKTSPCCDRPTAADRIAAPDFAGPSPSETRPAANSPTIRVD